MGTLQQQLEAAKKLTPKRVSNDLFDFLKSISKEIVEINKNKITNDSKDIFEKPIGYYSEATEYITKNNALLGKGNKIKYAGDPFDGDDTGDWLKGWYVNISNAELRFGSTDSKTELILKSDNWLSDELFGLTDKDLRELIDNQLLPFIIRNNRKILNV